MTNSIRSARKGLKVLSMLVLPAMTLGARGDSTTLPASSYVQDGLVLCYDGIENAGPGQHADAPTVWKNLGTGGASYDLSVLSRMTVGADGKSFVIGQDGASASLTFSTVSGIDTTKPYTIEVVSRFGGWKSAENYENLQNVIMTPRGGLGYRMNLANGFCVSWPAAGGTGANPTLQAATWAHPTARTADIHTMSSSLLTGSKQALMDGASGSPSDSGVGIGTSDGFKIFRNRFSELQVYSVRVYDRVLTDAELARNVAVDGIRFRDQQATFSVADIPAQVRRYYGTVSPKPTVTDSITGAALVEDVDYTLSYSGNDQFGTAVAKLVGRGLYEGFSSEKTFAVVSDVSVEIHEGAAGRMTADVTVPADAKARKVFVAYGLKDAGDAMERWTQIAEVGEIAAGATSAVGLSLPAEVGAESTAVRFFVEAPTADFADASLGLASNYGRDGLVLQYDGVENDGPGQRAQTLSVWKNLGVGGSDYDLTLPARITAGADGQSVVSGQGGKEAAMSFETVNGIDTTKPFTIEVVSRFGGWKSSENYQSLQSVVWTPRGGLGYRESNANGFYAGWPRDNGKVRIQSWVHPTAKRADIHTMAIHLRLNERSPMMDGVSSNPLADGVDVDPSAFRICNNTLSELQVYSVRVYNRVLTDAELARNVALDALRFRSGPVASVPLHCSRSVVAKVKRSGTSLSFGASPYARNAYVAWGSADAGSKMADWEHVAFIGRIPAAATTASGLALPAGAAQAGIGRFFIDLGTESLIQDGLVLCYDGVENVGRGTHDNAPSVWKNIGVGGSDYDLNLSSRITAGADGKSFVAGQGGSETALSFASVTGIDTNKPFTIEVVSRFRGWKGSDPNYLNLQSVVWTPRGGLGYRESTVNGFYAGWPTDNGKIRIQTWLHPTAKMADIHTMAIHLRPNERSPMLDGVSSDPLVGGVDVDPSVFMICQNTFSELQVYSVRVYNRVLTDDETSLNTAVDAMRFRGQSSTDFACSDVMSLQAPGLTVLIR